MHFSIHTLRRAAQRNITPSSLEMVEQFGYQLYRTGIIFYTIRRKEIVKYQKMGIDLSPYEGLTFLVHHDGTVITTYKNPQASRIIKKKCKRDLRKPGQA
ncbi:MAG: hypothetical protein HQK55_06175 [Deltaproteobacteria bacterium]|nr:hypothetical protein [Deltaproteobacteria bacterium]